MGRRAISDRTVPTTFSIRKSIAEDFRTYCEVVGKSPSQLVSDYIESLLQPYRDPYTGRVKAEKAIYFDENSIPQQCYTLSNLEPVKTEENAEADQAARLGSYLIAMNGALKVVPEETVKKLESGDPEPNR